jgi:transcriptional regulator with XRE-family HTH domain
MRLNAKLIKLLRISKGMRQKEFSHSLGISTTKLSFIENGINPVTPELDARIREIFRVDDVTIAALALAEYLGREGTKGDGQAG